MEAQEPVEADTKESQIIKKREAKLVQKMEEIKEMNQRTTNTIIKPTSTVKSNVIREGDRVLLVSNSGKSLIAKMKPSKKYKIGNFFIMGEEIIGCTYGTILENKNKQTIVKEDIYTLDQDIHSLEVNTEINNDNREIYAVNENQKLSYEEIEYRKSIGIRGQELIDDIVQNSETFNKRTKFSQEKYLKRLKKKHLNYVELRYPSLHHICDFVYDNVDNKSLKLRHDALGYILNNANLS